MNQPKLFIEDEILRVLLLLAAQRRSAGEQEIAREAIVEDLKKAIETETVTEIETGDRSGQELVPEDLLQLVLRPNLPAAVLELIAKMLNNDPEARRALVKLLTAANTPALVRNALTAVLAKCMERGYSNAEVVLREAYTHSKEPDHFIQAIRNTSSVAANTLTQKQHYYFSPVPKPR